MSQLDDSLIRRLERLEKSLEAYRKLHADEIQQIASEVAQLRREIEMLAKAPALDPERPPADEGQETSDAAECVRRSSLLQVSR